MDGLIELLNYLGITPQQLVPLFLVAGFSSIIYWRYVVMPDRAEFHKAKQELTDLHNATKELQLYLSQDDAFTPQHSLEQKTIFEQYGVHNSPMQPNAKGQKLLDDSGFSKTYPEIKQKIFEQMDRMNLRTPYDYEAGASKALILLSNDPSIDNVKNYVVNNPQEKLELIYGIASWVIRDDYTEYKKEESVAESVEE